MRECLEITIDGYILDADYLTKKFMQARFSEAGTGQVSVTADSPLSDVEREAIAEERRKTGFFGGTSVIGKMPACKGYPYKPLCHKVKNRINSAKKMFRAKDHTYLGIRLKVALFRTSSYAYVYVD